MKQYHIYILASKRNGTLYIGVTNNIVKRVYEHKSGVMDGFTKRYSVTRLVYFEQTSCVWTALQREQQLKKWNREWKIKLIEAGNPNWNDLYQSLIH